MESSSSLTSAPKDIVIIGGGVVGCLTAYYLTRHPLYNPEVHSITIVEAEEIAAGASGKSGGFLAEWATPRSIAPLSFRLHEDLAGEYNGAERWGYRRIYASQSEIRLPDDLEGSDRTTRASTAESGAPSSTGSDETVVTARSSHSNDSDETTVTVITVPDEPGAPANPPPPPNQPAAAEDPEEDEEDEVGDWVHQGLRRVYLPLGPNGNSAQVSPFPFIRAIAEEAEKAGVCVLIGSASAIQYAAPSPASTDRSVESVTVKVKDPGYEPETYNLPATNVVVAAGPWTSTLLPQINLLAPKTHNVTVRPRSDHLGPEIMFTKVPAIPLEVAIYPRPRDEQYPHSTVYAVGADNHDDELPETPSGTFFDREEINELLDLLCDISGVMDGDEVTATACHRAQIRRHEADEEVGPIVGPMPDVTGLWVATGLDEWEAQNGPAVGLLMSEMIFGGRAHSADVGLLDPSHFI